MARASWHEHARVCRLAPWLEMLSRLAKKLNAVCRYAAGRRLLRRAEQASAASCASEESGYLCAEGRRQTMTSVSGSPSHSM